MCVDSFKGPTAARLPVETGDGPGVLHTQLRPPALREGLSATHRERGSAAFDSSDPRDKAIPQRASLIRETAPHIKAYVQARTAVLSMCASLVLYTQHDV